MFALFRVTNLITIQRELEALRQVSSLKLLKCVLASEDVGKVDQDALSNEVDLGHYTLNDSQREAVLRSILREPSGFSLIQGPPGTGKTQSIVSIVSNLLSTANEEVKVENERGMQGWKARDAKQVRESARQHILDGQDIGCFVLGGKHH
jgi:Cdc6-like AAA superfamily ATPase